MIFHKNIKIVIWVPEGCPGAPGDPAESPAGPSDDLQMATMYEKSMRNATRKVELGECCEYAQNIAGHSSRRLGS